MELNVHKPQVWVKPEEESRKVVRSSPWVLPRPTSWATLQQHVLSAIAPGTPMDHPQHMRSMAAASCFRSEARANCLNVLSQLRIQQRRESLETEFQLTLHTVVPLIHDFAFCSSSYLRSSTGQNIKWKVPEINNVWVLNGTLFWVMWWNLTPFCSRSMLPTQDVNHLFV